MNPLAETARMSLFTTQQLAQAITHLQRSLASTQRQMLDVRKRLAVAEAGAALAAAGRRPSLPLRFTSQYGEDLLIWEALGRPLGGFYIEAGAFDGEALSVTYPLEAMGWTGLLVEAIPGAAEACRAARPGSRVVHAALAGPGGPPEAEFTVIDPSVGGVFSHLRADEHTLRATAAAKKTKVRVPLTTMDALLEGHAGPIDVAVLDVEGGEADLLRGFDLPRWRPRMLLVEDNRRGDPELDRILAAAGYAMAGWLEVNRVHVRADEPGLLERARAAL